MRKRSCGIYSYIFRECISIVVPTLLEYREYIALVSSIYRALPESFPGFHLEFHWKSNLDYGTILKIEVAANLQGDN